MDEQKSIPTMHRLSDIPTAPPAWSSPIGDWLFLPVYSSYTDLVGLSHGRMPCLRS